MRIVKLIHPITEKVKKRKVYCKCDHDIPYNRFERTKRGFAVFIHNGEFDFPCPKCNRYFRTYTTDPKALCGFWFKE